MRNGFTDGFWVQRTAWWLADRTRTRLQLIHDGTPDERADFDGISLTAVS